MTRAIQCDGCGRTVPEETLHFTIEDTARFYGGGFIDPEGQEHEWSHAELRGDLCSECAADVVAELDSILSVHPKS